MKKIHNILLTNDDGYNSVGINKVLDSLQSDYNLFVVAPMYHQSGMSSALKIGKQMSIKRYDTNKIALDGTPVNCVNYGLSALNTKFDLVISGINDGLNIADDTLYSGTIGACYESLLLHTPAIAFSADDLDLAGKYIKRVLDCVIKEDLIHEGYLLNINFPSVEPVKGLRLTIPHHSDATYTYKEDQEFISFTRNGSFDKPAPNSDLAAIDEGYISITPLSRSNFNEKIYDKFHERILKL